MNVRMKPSLNEHEVYKGRMLNGAERKPVVKSGQQITVDITGEVSTFQPKRKAIPFERMDQILILVNCTFFVIRALNSMRPTTMD